MRRVQKGHKQGNKDSDSRKWLLFLLFFQSGRFQRRVSRNKQTRFPPFRPRMDSRRGTTSFWRTRKVNPIIFRHGFGNWNDVADFIGTNKTREDVEEHYQQVYLLGANNFIPVNLNLNRTITFLPKEITVEKWPLPQNRVLGEDQVEELLQDPIISSQQCHVSHIVNQLETGQPWQSTKPLWQSITQLRMGAVPHK